MDIAFIMILKILKIKVYLIYIFPFIFLEDKKYIMRSPTYFFEQTQIVYDENQKHKLNRIQFLMKFALIQVSLFLIIFQSELAFFTSIMLYLTTFSFQEDKNNSYKEKFLKNEFFEYLEHVKKLKKINKSDLNTMLYFIIFCDDIEKIRELFGVISITDLDTNHYTKSDVYLIYIFKCILLKSNIQIRLEDTYSEIKDDDLKQYFISRLVDEVENQKIQIPVHLYYFRDLARNECNIK